MRQVLFKMDKAGDGQLVELNDLALNRELSFVGFTPQMFMEVRPTFTSGHLAEVTDITTCISASRSCSRPLRCRACVMLCTLQTSRDK